jgi:hypothetical protein
MADWLTRQEAAEYLKVSLRHLHRLPIPRSFVNSSPRYSRAAIDEWLEARAVEPAAIKAAGKPPRRAAPRLSAADWPSRLAALKRDLLSPRRR